MSGGGGASGDTAFDLGGFIPRCGDFGRKRFDALVGGSQLGVTLLGKELGAAELFAGGFELLAEGFQLAGVGIPRVALGGEGGFEFGGLLASGAEISEQAFDTLGSRGEIGLG